MHVCPDSTVIELSGPDRAGKLAEVTKLLMNNGCNVRSAAVRHVTSLLCGLICSLHIESIWWGLSLNGHCGAGVDIQGQGGICAECFGGKQACSRQHEAAKAETNHAGYYGR